MMRKILSLAVSLVFLLAASAQQAKPSLQGGRFIAANFGGWTVQIITIDAPNHYIYVAPTRITLQDGTTYNPWSTVCSLTIGSGAARETVLPSAFDYSTSGVVRITAPFSNLHFPGDPVTSGTFGLQEAIQAAHGLGGVITIDSNWSGDQTIIDAAALYGNIALEDVRTSLPGGGGGGGSGTVTSVATGAGLTGGPITTTGTISIADGQVTNAKLQNSTITINTTSPLAGGAAPALGGTITLSCPTCSTGGTITGVTAGAGLTGGGISGGVTLTLANPIASNTSGNAATATALAASPTQCTGGQFALGVAASGNAVCATPSGSSSGNVTNSGTPTSGQIAQWVSSTSISGVSGSLTGSFFANQGTTTTLLHGNVAGNQSYGKVALATDISGVMPIANGGTNSTTQAAAAVAILPSCTSTQIINWNGSAWACIANATGTVTTTGSPAASQIAQFSAGTSITNGNLSGDASTTNSLVVTVAKVNSVAFPAAPATNTVPVITSSNQVTWEKVPNAALLNPATTVNGQTCTLGSTCTISGGGSGTVTSVSGTSNQISVANGTTTPVISLPSPVISPGAATINGDLTVASSGSGAATWTGTTSGSAAVGVAAIAGSPAQINLPIATAVAGAFLQSNGANPQVTSWVFPAGTAPTTSGDACTAGMMARDTSFLYVCVATNTWRRVATASF